MSKLHSPKLNPRGRKIKILATVGPASADPDMLRRLLRAGADEIGHAAEALRARLNGET